MKIKLMLTLLASALLGSPPAWTADIDSSLEVVSETNQQAISTQKRIDSLALQTEKMLEEYQRIIRKTDYQDAYNAQLEQLKENQEKEILSLQEQINDQNETQMRIMPLMMTMADALEKFVVLDLPFHQQQRVTGVIQLKQRLHNPSLSVPEKYRLLLEAFQVENDYGRTIETYRDALSLDGVELSVEYLRIGRVALYYRTLDGERSGYWRASEKEWLSLPDSYNSDLADAIRVADNQVAPKLVSLPMVNRQ